MENNGDFYGGLFGRSSVPPGFSLQSKHTTTTTTNSSISDDSVALPKHTMDDIATMLNTDGGSFFSSNLYADVNQLNTFRSTLDNSVHSMPRSVTSNNSLHGMQPPHMVNDSVHTIEKITTMHMLNNDNHNTSSTNNKNRLALASDQILLCAASLLQNQAQHDSKANASVTEQRKPFVYTEFNAIPSLPLELGGICHPTQISPDTQKRELIVENGLSDDIVAGIVPTIHTMFR